MPGPAPPEPDKVSAADLGKPSQREEDDRLKNRGHAASPAISTSDHT